MTEATDHEQASRIRQRARVTLAVIKTKGQPDTWPSPVPACVIADGCGLSGLTGVTAVDVALRDSDLEFRQVAGDWQGWRWCLTASDQGKEARRACVRTYGGTGQYQNTGTGIPSVQGADFPLPASASPQQEARTKATVADKIRTHLTGLEAGASISELMRAIGCTHAATKAALWSMRDELTNTHRSYTDGKGRPRKVSVMLLRSAGAA